MAGDERSGEVPEPYVGVPDRLGIWMNGIDGDYHCPDEVDAFIGWMRENHPAQLAEYAAGLTRSSLLRLACDQRNRKRAVSRRIATADRIEATAARYAEARAVDPAAPAPSWMTVYDARYPVDGKNTMRRLGDMDAEDHRFVSRAYLRSAHRELALAKFHEAIARRLMPGQVTSDIIPVETYVRQLQSILGEDVQTLAASVAAIAPTPEALPAGPSAA